METILSETNQFKCPKCGGKYFSRDAEDTDDYKCKITKTVCMSFVSGKDYAGPRCDWEGNYWFPNEKEYKIEMEKRK